MDNPLRELAKEHTLQAMKIEIQQNQQLIDTTPVYRNTYRTTKIEVLRAIVRNHILRQYMELCVEDQNIQNFKKLNGNSDEFKIFVYNTSAKSYAYQIKYRAEKELFLDYTHVDYKNNSYFLDEILPEKTKVYLATEKILTVVYFSIFFSLKYWWLTIICLLVIFSYIDSDYSPTNNNSSMSTNGKAEGNSDNKMRSLDVQIEDHSTASNFGNEGISGNDSSENSVDDTTTESVVDASLSNMPYEAVKSDDYSFEEDTEDQTPVLLPVEQTEPVAIEIPEETFTIGSTKDQVKTVMGNPTSNLGSSWNYGYSSVQFDQDEQVRGWSNISHNLKAYMGDKNEQASTFTLNSAEKDVIDSMGTPTSIIGTTWGYEYSMINFDRNHTVIGWSNISDNLNVSIGLAQKDAIPFTTYSSKQDVIDAMGTPTSIIGDTWSYDYSSIRFNKSGKVISWSDISHNLRTDSLD